MGRWSWLLDNLGLKLLSVVLAVFLWAVVVGEQKVEVTLNVPLDIKALPRHLVVTNEPTDVLEVRVRGPKTLVSTLSPSEVVLEGMSRNFVEGENLIAVRPEMVHVPRGIEVVDVSPHRVRMVLDAIVEREVEVSPRVEGKLAKGYVVKGVASSPPRIRITGPRSDLQRLARVYTLPINLEGRSTSFTTRAMLEPVARRVRSLDDTPIIVAVDIGTAKP